MAPSESSHYGLAKQSAKGTENTTDGDFKFWLFNEGSVSPNNVVIPADDGVGGGAILTEMAKVGVTSAGGFTLVPRSDIVGDFLLGAMGDVAAASADGLGYEHEFTLGSDQFDAPYYTIRADQGGLFGETFIDMRVAGLVFNWRALDYIRAQLAFIGGTCTPDVSMTTWGAHAAVDRGPSFIAPVTTVTWPGETPKVLGGQIAMGMAIPLDEQWITGSYAPDDFAINSRAFSFSFTMKVADVNIYEKVMYDPLQGGAWAAGMLKEGGVVITLTSTTEYDTSKPHKIVFTPDASEDNVAWSVTPLRISAGRQVTMLVTGTILQSTANEPLTVGLFNDVSATYGTIT